MRHVVEIQQFDTNTLSLLFTRAAQHQEAMGRSSGRKKLANRLAGQLLLTIFYEPSTRTRVSFAAAGHNLGMHVISTENAREFSSAIKGESLEDTIKVLCEYSPSIIVLRHTDQGSAQRAAAVSSVPIINAGDGGHQHPTQAILDLYTIQRECGRTDNLTVAIGTDLLHSRTTRSLSYLLGKFKGNRLLLVSPKSLRMGQDIKDYLLEQKVDFQETEDMESALKQADVIYWNRIQKERFSRQAPLQNLTIQPKHLALLKKQAVIMDPLPRVDQIHPSVDNDPRAAYFRQAGNGMFVRMALMEWVLELL